LKHKLWIPDATSSIRNDGGVDCVDPERTNQRFISLNRRASISDYDVLVWNHRVSAIAFQFYYRELCCFGKHPFIKRVALERQALTGKNGVFQCFSCHFLPMPGPCGARDTFIHQRATQIIGAGLQAHSGACQAHLHPGCLDVADMRRQNQP